MTWFNATVMGNDDAHTFTGGILAHLVREIDRTFAVLADKERAKRVKEIPLPALVDLLNDLGGKYPQSFELFVDDDKINEWIEIFETWVKENPSLIPKKYREEFLAEARAVFQKCLEIEANI